MEPPWAEPFFARIRELGISQNEAARRAGVDPGNLSKVLAGKATLGLRGALGMQAALGLDPAIWLPPENGQGSAA